jgi:diaminopimelate epimerase
MRLKFTKMHGLGNDFVVFDATHAPLELSREQLRRISDRHFGVGCDQILFVEQPRQPDTDFYYRIFNADGSEVEQCGNGARCFVRYVREHGLTGKNEFRVGTLGGVIVPRLEADGQVTVNMGVPEFDPSRIPFQAERRAPTYMLDVGGRQLEIRALSMGKIRTQCSLCRTWNARPCKPRARQSRFIRASRSASTLVTCRW